MADPDDLVRSARVALARALATRRAGADDMEEAEQLLVRALDGAAPVPRAGPADWEILVDLAQVAQLRSQTQREATFLVEAVSAAPTDAAAELAERVLRLLEADSGGTSLVEGLPSEVAGALWAAAHDPGRPDAVVQLAARLALARGHVTAASEVSRQRESVTTADNDLHAVGVATSVLDLLANGEVDEAEAQLVNVRHLAHEPAVVLAEALLLYARGEIGAARVQAESWSGAGDLGAVAVIALLRQAALAVPDANDVYKAARTAASRAARHDPSAGEPVLLRAQVLLETGLELDLGRSLLQTALDRLERPDALAWWRIQERARSDDRYLYFRAEVASATGDRAAVRRLAASFGAVGTTNAQNARLKELWAEAVEDPAESAALLKAAAGEHRQADDLPSVIRCLRLALEKQPDSQSGLDLADALWTSSFTENGSAAAGYLAEGLAVMGRLEGQHPESSVERASLQWGLLLARADVLAEIEHQVRPDQRWRSLPHLLLAALLDPWAPYTWAHLAWACGDADLRWPAAWASRKALELLPQDQWLLQTCLVSEVNWSGMITEELRVWLREVPPEIADPGWVAAASAFDLLIRGRVSEATELLPQIDFDAWWAREIRVLVLILGRSLDVASKDVVNLVDEAAQRGHLWDAAWWALMVDKERSGALAEQAAIEGVGGRGRQLQQATVELVSTDGQRGSDRLLAALEHTCRPSRLREDGILKLRLLAAAHQDRPHLCQQLESLSRRAEDLLDVLDPAPRLTAELDVRETWCADAELGLLVHQLLQHAEGNAQKASPLAQVPWLPGSATAAAASDLLVGG